MSILRATGAAAKATADPRDLEADTTDHAEPFGPTSIEDAERLGHELALSDEDPAPPAGWGDARTLAFMRGLHGGWAKLLEDKAEYAAYLESLRDHEPHHAEFCEAGAYLAPRHAI